MKNFTLPKNVLQRQDTKRLCFEIYIYMYEVNIHSKNPSIIC